MAFCVRAGPGPSCEVLVPGRGAELGDGVRSGSLAGVSTRPMRGFPEWVDLEERWRCLRHTGQLRSEPGTVEVSHRYPQRSHFAQTCESECLPGGGAKGPKPIVVGSACGPTLIGRSRGQSRDRYGLEGGLRTNLR